MASAANAFVLGAVTTNERRLRSSAYGTTADPWTQQLAFSAAAQPRFGSKPWHKAALVVLIIFGGLLASLVIYAIVTGAVAHDAVVRTSSRWGTVSLDGSSGE